MTQVSPAVRGFLHSPLLPALALALTIIGWIGLAPWRPILAGDDWGFYDSVTRTIIHGRPIVSDWLAPATVGLTLPAAGMTLLVGDLWGGSMLVMGIFGLVGLVALWFLLRALAVRPTRIALTILVLGFFPIYLGKWTRFESCLPSVSLFVSALALLIPIYLPTGRETRREFLYSLGAGVCIAWAIAIRQNHVVIIPVGALGILLMPGLRQRALLLIAWALPAVVTIIALRLGVPLSFAQRTATFDMVSAHFSVVGYLAALLRALCFSSGMALLIALLIVPGTIIIIVRQITRLGLIIGACSMSILLTFAARHQGWLAPDTDILALMLVRHTLLALTTILGGLFWWPIITRALRSPTTWLASGLLLMVAGYLGLVAAWGYWEYYLFEPILLLVIVLLLPTSDRTESSAYQLAPPSQSQLARAGRLDWLTILAVYVILSWNIQRMSNDTQATQLQVLEQAFRDRITVPADTDQIPFGLLG